MTRFTKFYVLEVNKCSTQIGPWPWSMSRGRLWSEWLRGRNVSRSWAEGRNRTQLSLF